MVLEPRKNIGLNDLTIHAELSRTQLLNRQTHLGMSNAQRRQCGNAKGLTWQTPNQELHDGVVVGQIHQIAFVENRLELLHQKLSVFRTAAVGQHGADVTKDGVANLIAQLTDKLVGHDQV